MRNRLFLICRATADLPALIVGRINDLRAGDGLTDFANGTGNTGATIASEIISNTGRADGRGWFSLQEWRRPDPSREIGTKFHWFTSDSPQRAGYDPSTAQRGQGSRHL